MMDRRLRALVVDDSEEDTLLLVRELHRGGYTPTVERVDTADQMTVALERRSWDVVLADCAMPSFSALAALSLLKASGLDIPFIIVSGTIGEETAVEAMRSGAQDFMIKGKLARLLPAIEREVRAAERRRERRAERARTEAEREQLLTELREAVQVRDTFLAIAAHELKTPLTALQLQIRLLQTAGRQIHESMSAQAPEAAIEVIARQGARLHALIENILDVVSITSGRMNLDREPVDLGRVVSDVVARADTTSRSRLEIAVEAQAVVVGSWDRLRLEAVLATLLSNAVKFGEGKPIRIAVSCEGLMARVDVTDHGMGIAPEQRARIFEKFERAVSERQYGGFGLGLWVARQIVEAHGGNIRVASEAGHGSTFVVELPLSGYAIARSSAVAS